MRYAYIGRKPCDCAVAYCGRAPKRELIRWQRLGLRPQRLPVDQAVGVPLVACRHEAAVQLPLELSA